MSAEATTQSTEPTTTQKELTELLTYIRQQTIAGVESGKTLVSEQSPLVAKEIIAREISLSSAGIALAAALTITAVVGSRKFWTAYKNSRDKRDDGSYYTCSGNEGFAAGAITTPIVCGVGALVVGISSSIDLLNALVAPRLVILDYLKHLL